MWRHIQKFNFLLFWIFLSYVVCAPSLKSINSSSLSRKKYDGGNFTPTPSVITRSKYVISANRVNGTYWAITPHYKPFFQYWVLQTFLHDFLLFLFVWNKMCCFKTWALFYIFWFGLEWHSLLHYEMLCVSGAPFIRL